MQFPMSIEFPELVSWLLNVEARSVYLGLFLHRRLNSLLASRRLSSSSAFHVDSSARGAAPARAAEGKQQGVRKPVPDSHGYSADTHHAPARKIAC